MYEENKAVVRRFLIETQNNKNLAVIDEVVAEDFIGHTANLRGSANLKKVINDNLSAFPDLQVTIEDQISEGDTVASRYTARGTHKGVYRGVPPTGEAVEFTVISINRLAGGKITEGWRVVDRLDIMHQIGAVS